MRILVCVKQVPESGAPVSIDENGKWVEIGGGAEFRMNHCDACAVEEAVLIKAADPGTVVDVVTVGPKKAETVVRRAIGMGVDNGVHIVTADDAYLDAFLTAGALASYADGKAYDLILTGVMSEDLMQAQVGPLMAANLDMICISAVVFEKLSADGRSVYVEREVENGCRETGDIRLPVLLTMQTGINTPRYPALSKLLRANKLKIGVIDANMQITVSSPQTLMGVAVPDKKRDALFLEGSAVEKAERLMAILKERSLMG